MLSEKISFVLVKRKKSKKELAAMLNIAPSSLYSRFKKDNWNENELKEIAEVLDFKIETHFILKDTGDIF